MHFLPKKTTRKIAIISAAIYLFLCLVCGMEVYASILSSDITALSLAAREYYRIHRKLPEDASDLRPLEDDVERFKRLADIKIQKLEEGEIVITAYDTQLFRKVRTRVSESYLKDYISSHP